MLIKKPNSSKLYCEENLQTMNQVFFNGYFSFIFFFIYDYGYLPLCYQVWLAL